MADLGEVPRGGRPPLFLDQTEARRAKKNLFGDPLPPYLRVWMIATELCNYQQQQNFINKQINLQKYCLQLARLFKAGQCVQNIKIETKAINIIILSRGLIQLSG